MPCRRHVSLLVVVCVLLAGCGGAGSTPGETSASTLETTETPTSTPTSTAAQPIAPLTTTVEIEPFAYFPACNEVHVLASEYDRVSIAVEGGEREVYTGDFAGPRTFETDGSAEEVIVTGDGLEENLHVVNDGYDECIARQTASATSEPDVGSTMDV